MTQEKFNDAMVRLRQAEEDLNKALQYVAAVINETERKDSSTELQAQIDEAYNKGIQDLYDALCIFSEPVPKMREIFDSVYIEKIILKYSPKEIIDKVNQWKAEKDKEEQKLRVGDEIEYTFPGKEPEKCIVIGLDGGIDNEKIIWTIGLDLSQRSWFSSNCYWGETYHKTGKHYDAIPFPEEIKQ